jgi:single-stranded-DNA-specific exonuclease
MRCVGWDWAERCLNMQLAAGSLVDVAYRIRENDHPQYGGVEIEIAGIRPAEA